MTKREKKMLLVAEDEAVEISEQLRRIMMALATQNQLLGEVVQSMCSCADALRGVARLDPAEPKPEKSQLKVVPSSPPNTTLTGYKDQQ